MKKIFFTCLGFFSLLSSSVAQALTTEELKQGVIPSPSTITHSGSDLQGLSLLDYILGFFRDSIFALMALIAIGMFLFIGGRLVVARGNPEEFKKAMLSFVYAAIGIFVVAAAWAMVKLVAGIDI